MRKILIGVILLSLSVLVSCKYVEVNVGILTKIEFITRSWNAHDYWKATLQLDDEKTMIVLLERDLAYTIGAKYRIMYNETTKRYKLVKHE